MYKYIVKIISLKNFKMSHNLKWSKYLNPLAANSSQLILTTINQFDPTSKQLLTRYSANKYINHYLDIFE